MKKKRILRQFIYIALVLTLIPAGLSFSGGSAFVEDGQEIDLPPMDRPLKVHPKLDSVLERLFSEHKNGQVEAAAFAQQRNIDFIDNLVTVTIEAAPGELDNACVAAAALGADIEASYENLVRVSVPVSALIDLAEDPAVRFVRLPLRPVPLVVSEGMGLINADVWHMAGYTGAGVKIGILDGGFNGYTGLLGTELPAAVTTQWFGSGGTEGTSVHGTACAEIVYDIAPDADFYLTNIDDGIDFGNAVDWLISQGVDVISCSLIWPAGGTGDGTGYFCDRVTDARAAGILWAQAAGNYAQSHWQGDWQDTDGDSWLEFDPGDELIYINAEG